MPVLNIFQQKLHSELISKCLQITKMCEHECLPLAENSESRVFFLKLIADYYRYAVESFGKDKSNGKDDDYSNFIKSASSFYAQGM